MQIVLRRPRLDFTIVHYYCKKLSLKSLMRKSNSAMARRLSMRVDYLIYLFERRLLCSTTITCSRPHGSLHLCDWGDHDWMRYGES